jgi:hypothetical protein
LAIIGAQPARTAAKSISAVAVALFGHGTPFTGRAFAKKFTEAG